MPVFPLFTDISHKVCLILGGGKVALRKINTLLLFSCDIQVYASKLDEAVEGLVYSGRIKRLPKECDMDAVLKSAFLVVCATSDEGFNHELAMRAKALGLWVNSVTSLADSSFIFPAVVVRDDISIGISTSGLAPSLSRHIREDVEAALPLWYAALGARLFELRNRLKDLEPDSNQRAALMGKLTEYGLEHDGEIPETVFEKIVRR